MRLRGLHTTLAALAFLIAPHASMAETVRYEPLRFSEILGWGQDDHAAALDTFRKSCGRTPRNSLVTDAEWRGVCQAAEYAFDARTFFEAAFRPVVITDGASPLFTAYFEPELIASPVRTGPFQHPIYRPPPELNQPWLTRAQIENGILEGRGLEIAWLADPVDAFFLHVQGSGRLAMTDGSVKRVGFADRNGHPYRSVGRHMAQLGIFSIHQASAANIRAWVQRNPRDGQRILQHNPSYIFFREITDLSPEDGPIGAMSLPVTARRSAAVDPAYTPLGAPVWIETDISTGPWAQLMIAQDVGSAINGAQRADLFLGSGSAAGDLAGRVKGDGRMITLLPVATADRLLRGN
jgi:membrane-bound lytic murein transglycosylase A